MNEASVSSRYDEFQRDAVSALVEDFRKQPSGRFLLVIPTGGGKTFTAVKAINQLFADQILAADSDEVLWVAHRAELITQAEDTFVKFTRRFPTSPSYAEKVIFQMISSASQTLAKTPSIKLIVIDEAHHGAANSYLPLFANSKVGVLGLTATPTRHDGKPLEFERESYSIGFPDLVDCGVILRPEVRTVAGGVFDISNIDDVEALEALNTEARNKHIAQALLSAPDDYKKVVIYVGTKKHAEDLSATLRASPLNDLYESIGYVHGSKNSAGLDRAAFLSQEKKRARSILVNVQILSEGYDDPAINTVVMATPTRSKLVYMQAMGRAIRRDPTDELKRAFVVEVADELPNIRYRIDNRWLYSDISDALEPQVRDVVVSDEREFHSELRTLYEEHRVLADKWTFPELRDGFRYGLLLFKVYRGPGDHTHVPLLIDNSNRLAVSNSYNYISERMTVLARDHVNSTEALRMARVDRIAPAISSSDLRSIYDAMCNCVSTSPDIATAMPWVTFVAFRLRRRPAELPAALLDFLAGMINREEVVETILRREFLPGSMLVRLPLPLVGFIGRIVTTVEFDRIRALVESLREVKEAAATYDHRPKVRDLLDDHVLPLPIGDAQALVLIARTAEPYSYPL